MSGVLLGTEMVKKRFIEKRMKELTDGYTVADAIFMRDASDTPSITYESNEEGLNSMEKSSEVEQRTEGGKYPRIKMTTSEKQALIKDYGLSTVISYEAIRFNRISDINRAYLLLGNSLVKFVDTRGLNALTDSYNTASTRIHTAAAGVAWDQAAADPFADIMTAVGKVNNIGGYLANTAVVNSQDWVNAFKNKDFRKELDTDVPPERKIARKGVLAGQIAGITILVSQNMTEGFMWVGQDQVVGNRSETNDGVDIDTYKQDNSQKSDTIVDAFREVEHYLTDPKAGCLVSGLKT